MTPATLKVSNSANGSVSLKVKFSYALVVLHLLMLALIVLPFVFYEDLFDRLATELLSGQRSLEVFLATAFLLMADVFIPVPSSAVSVSPGMLLATPLAFLACFLGLSAGALLGYGFGYYFRRMHFERWYRDDEFRTLSMHLSRYGLFVLLICRGIPILAELSVMVAGFHRYPFRKFIGIVSLGNLVLAFLYSVIGDRVADVTSVYVLAAVFLSYPMITYTARLLWLRRVEKA